MRGAASSVIVMLKFAEGSQLLTSRKSYQEVFMLLTTQVIDPSPKWRPKIQISLNKLKLKVCTDTRKNNFTLVTLQSFSISGVVSAQKM